MNDSELLELAAKAASMSYITPADSYDGSHGLEIGTNPMRTTSWNPLIDDGDALRLAVKLSIRVYPPEPHLYSRNSDKASSNVFGKGWYGEEVQDNNAYAATRRAIVRAAAEIGMNERHSCTIDGTC